MAKAEDYAAWIVKNQDKRGTPEFDTVSAAYKQARGNTQTAVAPEVALDPTEGMSTFDKVAAGAGQALTNVGRGVGQLVGMVSQADIDEAKKRDAPLEKTTAGTVGNVIGNIAAFAPTALIPGANTVTGAATIGALSSALATPGQAADRATAGLLGGAGGALGQLIPRAIGSLKAAAEPLTEAGRARIIGRLMNKSIGDDASTVAGRLRTAQPLVPGSMPTAAEVGESGGLAALQRAMSAADPEAYAHRGMQQNAARVDALRGIAGDDVKMAAAVAARDSASKSLYNQANMGVAPIDNTFTGLMQRPQFNAAVNRASELAKDKGLADIFFRDSKGKPIGLIGEGAHYIKKSLDEAGEFGSTSYTSKASAGAANDTNSIFQNWLNKSIPEYSDAKTAFAAGSRPINQMQIGQELLEKLSPSLTDSGALAKETAAKYATALRNGDQTARAATGFRQGLDGVMDPTQMQTINNVAKDLARKSNAQDLGRGVGSNTFQNFAMDNLAQTMGMPSAVKALGSMIPGMAPTTTLLVKGGQALGGMAYKTADEQMRVAMAQALLNPQAAAHLMDAASKPQMLARLLQKLPAGTQKALPPEELLRLLQAAPGVVGMGLANAHQQ